MPRRYPPEFRRRVLELVKAGRPVTEVLGIEVFDTLLEAQVVIEDWRSEYNTVRPHSSLGWLAPGAYAESCRGG